MTMIRRINAGATSSVSNHAGSCGIDRSSLPKLAPCPTTMHNVPAIRALNKVGRVAAKLFKAERAQSPRGKILRCSQLGADDR